MAALFRKPSGTFRLPPWGLCGYVTSLRADFFVKNPHNYVQPQFPPTSCGTATCPTDAAQGPCPIYSCASRRDETHATAFANAPPIGGDQPARSIERGVRGRSIPPHVPGLMHFSPKRPALPGGALCFMWDSANPGGSAKEFQLSSAFLEALDCNQLS